MTTKNEPQSMNCEYLAIGDTVSDSPVGPGTITGITDAGFSQVNHVAVARLTRTDGIVFDPHGTYEKEARRKATELEWRNATFVDSLLKETTPFNDPISEEAFLNLIQTHQELSGRISLTFDTDAGTKLTSVAKTLLKACNAHLVGTVSSF